MKNSADLTAQIENLVQAHLAAIRAEAAAAVARAFTEPTGSPGPRKRRMAAVTPTAPRRSREEIERLSDALLKFVEKKPGTMMATMAPQLGMAPRALQRPMELLKKAGRVRSVGQRGPTRYFPVATKP